MLSLRTIAGISAAQNGVTRHTNALRKTTRQLSSGKRVESAADDPAGIALAQKFRARSRSSTMAIRNINDGISMLTIAEAALAQMTELTHRMREIATQSMSDGMTDNERLYLDTEFQTLKAEVRRVNEVTEFNGISLTDHGGTLNFVTHNDGSGITVDMPHHKPGNLGLIPDHVRTRHRAGLSQYSMDVARNVMNRSRARLGSAINILTAQGQFEQDQVLALETSRSSIEDLDFAMAAAEHAKHSVMQQAAIAMVSQSIKSHQGILKLLG